ncbi:MAG TPA: hypothetical protein VLM40_17285 [Gemmata sp.]|nr:hypothetical protein [Gemmata sp.]
MSNELQSWQRPLFTPGGGDALLFYVVFGTFDLKIPLSRSRYRTSGLPPWLELVHYDRSTHAEVVAAYRSGSMWEMFRRDMPITVAETEAVSQCVALRAEVKDPPTLDYFRDVIGIVAWLLDAGGIAVKDPQMLWLWSADEWREEAFDPGEPNPDRHTVILTSPDEDGTTWYHTRGMRKFGRPDLSVHRVGEKYGDEVAEMLERFVELQARGGIIPESQTIQMKSLPEGGMCWHRGSLDDPDFNNVHIEIAWPPGALLGEDQ